MVVLLSRLETGVYCILNRVNGRRYIGSAARSFKARWGVHKSELKSGRHCNTHLKRAWDKYGEGAFEFLVIERCAPDKCIEREQYWINFYLSSSLESVYNLCPTAGSHLGLRLTEEQKANFSIAAKKRGRDPRIRTKISRSAKKRYESLEERAKASARVKKKLSDPIEKAKHLREIKLAVMSGFAKTALVLAGMKTGKSNRGKKRKKKEGSL